MRITQLVCALLLALSLGFSQVGRAAISSYEFDDPQREQQYRELIAELRCPKCQNQNIADSDAPLAADLRQKVYGMVKQGQSSEAVVEYMVQRYGDFVTYRPPLKPLTWVLWFGPAALLTLTVLLLLVWIRRRNREPSLNPLSDAEQARLQQLLGQHREGPL